MKKIICFTTSILFAVLLYGQTVSVSKTAVSVGNKSGDKVSFGVTADSYWGIYDLPVWLASDTVWFNGNQTVTLYAAANPLYFARVDTIKVYWFDASYSNYYETPIVVTQSSSGSGVSRNALSFTAAKGSTDTFSIKTSYYWELQNLPAWLTVNKNFITGNASITASATEENPLYTSRSANFKLIRATSATTADTSTIVATQAASTSGVSSNLVIVAAAEGSKAQFDVRAAGAWSVSSTSKLFTIAPTSGSGNDTVHITASINTNAYYKADSVYVTLSNGKKLLVVVAQQPASAYCTISPTALNFGAWSGSAVSAQVSSNTSWGVATLPKWLTTDSLWGYADSSFTLTAHINTLTKERRDTALLYWFDGNNMYYSKPVVFTQAAATYGLSDDTLIFNSDKCTRAVYVTSNSLWQFTDNPAWATNAENWKTSSDSVHFTVEANPLTSNRLSTVSFYRYTNTVITDTSHLVLVQAASSNGVSDTLVAFTASATETQKIAIAASASWTVSSKPQWITLAKQSGTGNDTLRISALANTETYYRCDTIKLMIGTKLVRIVVLQNPAASQLSVSANKINLLADGQSASLRITSNTSWSAFVKASWLNADTIWGYKDSSITITAAENMQTSERTDTVVVSWKKDGVYTEEKIAIVQAASASGISKSAVVLQAAAGSTDKISVVSNAMWEIANIPSWVTLDNNYQSGNAVVTITAANNPLNTSRTAIMQFRRYYTAVDYYTTDITVTQMAATSGVDKVTYTVAATAGSTVEVAYSGTASVSVSEQAAWLTYTIANNKIRFAATENPLNIKRADTLLLTFSNGQKTNVSITQDASLTKVILSSTSVAFAAADASTANLSITSNAQWGITGLPTWLKADTLWAIGTYRLLLTAQANTATSTRSDSFTLYWYDENKNYFDTTITVQQAGVGLSLLVSPQQMPFAAVENSRELAITSNVSWTIANANSWISIDKLNGSNSATVSVTAKANTRTQTRSASITVSGNGVATQTISIVQAAAAAQLSVSLNAYQAKATVDGFSFAVRSNVAWTIVSSSTDWLHVAKTTGSDTSDVSVTIDQNLGIQSRTATISISADGLSTQTISVKQSGAVSSLETSTNTLSFGTNKESQTVSVTSNLLWTVNTSASWIHLDKTGASGSADLVVTVDTNKTTAVRTAEIVINASNGTSKTIAVSQAASAKYFKTNTTAVSALATAGSYYIIIDANVDWTATATNNEWMGMSIIKTDNLQAILVQVIANTATSTRSASINIVSAEFGTKIISITQDAGAAYLTTNINKITATENSVTNYVIVNANVEWTVSSSTVDWLSVTSVKNDSVQLIVAKIAANTSTTARSASITISGTGVSSKTIAVTQAELVPRFAVNVSRIDVPSKANTDASVVITSNQSWTVTSDSDWLTCTIGSGTGTDTITFSATESTLTESRSAYLSFTAANGTKQSVKVVQAAVATTLAVSITWIEVGAVANSGSSFTIASNKNWYIKTDSKWALLSTNSGIGTEQIQLFIAANTADTSRLATYEVHDADDNITYVFVKQAAGLTAVTEANELAVQLYPNPVASELHLTSAVGSVLEQLSLYNTSGEVLINKTLGANEASVAVEQLPDGIYYVLLRVNGQLVKKEIVKGNK